MTQIAGLSDWLRFYDERGGCNIEQGEGSANGGTVTVFDDPATSLHKNPQEERLNIWLKIYI